MVISTKELYSKRSKLVLNSLGILCPISVAKAQGSIITDVEGKEYIDFAGGIGSLNIGHCPPAVVRAIQTQAEKFIHTTFNIAVYEQYLNLCEHLIDLFPHGDHTKVLLACTGSEAVENAIKIARQATNKSAIVSFTQAFHGRSLMATSLSSKTKNKHNIGPFASEVYRLPFPNYQTYAQYMSEEEFLNIAIKDVETFFKTHVGFDNTAAIILELVQGEGGFYVFPKPYVEALKKIAQENNILLIFDEIQSGFGRTGEWAAYHHYGITPDISTWGKSLGSGMPISCVMMKNEIAETIKNPTIGGTYKGNPLAAVSAQATIEQMKEVDICSLGKKVGSIAREKMNEYQRLFPNIVGEVRGLGAMLAFDIIKNGDWLSSNPTLTKDITNECAKDGLVIISAGIEGSTIRMLSPLNIDEALLLKGLDILKNVLQKFA